MKRLVGKILGLSGAVALILFVGALSQTLPAAAAGPVNVRTFPEVLGVNGSSMSIAQIGATLPARLLLVSQSAPESVLNIGGSSTPAMVTMFRLASNRRFYLQVSGDYCKNKTGGDVFVPDGAPVDPGLTC